MEAELFNKIDSNSIVLTPNRRLSTHLLSNYDNWQMQRGHLIWPTPTILPISIWVALLWEQLKMPSLVLSSHQEFFYWQEAIQESDYRSDIINLESAAKLAQEAWNYLCHWQKSIHEIHEFNNLEVQAFSQWANNYQTYCKRDRCIDTHQMIEQLIEQASKLQVPKQIYLIGFEELQPLQQALLEALPAEKYRMSSTQAAKVSLLAQENTQQEISAMLRWAKSIHEKEPSAKILCVLPELAQDREELVLQVNKLFFPQALFDSEFVQNTVNISGGYPLTQAPIIKAALLLTNLFSYDIDYQSLSQLLSCAYIQGAETELSHWALIDTQLRQLNEPRLTWKLIFQCIAEYQQIEKVNYGQGLVKMLEENLQHLKNLPKTASYAQWRDSILAILGIFDWPGPANLNSREYQQVEHFYETLNEFAKLNHSSKEVSFSLAKKHLQQILNNTLFQEQTINGPIQILGLLEAAGLECDYIWLMGLDSTSWPAIAKPNPFIPAHLQRQWKMPHNSAERELQFAQGLQRDFIKNCREMIFSYAKFDGESELQASTLLKNIPEISLAELNLAVHEPIEMSIKAKAKLSYFEDFMGNPINSTEKIKGGTGIFKSQAACPFQAFARYRLNATALAIPELYLSAAERGQLLHLALESIWEILGSQAKLLEKTEAELLNIIQGSIDQAFQTLLPYYSQKFKARFKKLERQRLQKLLLAWLNLEKTRPAFSVLAHEKSKQTSFGNLTINMRIDRIDQLANGEQLVIDYKTGTVNLNNCLSERLKEPQLPLYCSSDRKIKGLSFAEIRADKLGFKGLSAYPSNIPGINIYAEDEWQQLMLQWQESLVLLAAEFNQGLASVTPEPNACDYCELDSLCRIQELSS